MLALLRKSVLLLALLSSTGTVTAAQPAGESDTPNAQRNLPSSYSPGTGIDVEIHANPGSAAAVYAVEERLPPGWLAHNINHHGEFSEGAVRWGPHFDTAQRFLSYTAVPPLGAEGAANFEGTIAVDGTDIRIAGEDTTHADSTALPDASAQRSLPSHYYPGEPFGVEIEVIAGSSQQNHLIEEIIPRGWTVHNISHDGDFSRSEGRIVWGPFADSATRTLSYEITARAGWNRPALFYGFIFLDGEAFLTGGDTVIAPSPPSGDASARRILPSFYRPGAPFVVQVDVDPGSAAPIYALEERIPDGWTAQDPSHDGAFVASSGVVRWGPFFDSNPRSLSYQVMPPPESRGVVHFAGVLSVEGANTEAGGSGSIADDQYEISGAFTISLLEGSGPSPIGAVAHRALPNHYQPGHIFRVRLHIRPGEAVREYSVEEFVPAGWEVSNISDQGSFDPAERRILWGSWKDGRERVIQYWVRPPDPISGPADFSGRVVIGAATIEGSSTTTASQ